MDLIDGGIGGGLTMHSIGAKTPDTKRGHTFAGPFDATVCWIDRIFSRREVYRLCDH